MKLVTYDDGRVGKVVGENVIELDVADMRTYFELGGAVEATGQERPLAEVTLRAPIIPKKFFHTAGDFREHHEESKRVNWSHPVLPWIVFFQNVDAIIGPDQPIVCPKTMTNERRMTLQTHAAPVRDLPGAATPYYLADGDGRPACCSARWAAPLPGPRRRRDGCR